MIRRVELLVSAPDVREGGAGGRAGSQWPTLRTRDSFVLVYLEVLRETGMTFQIPAGLRLLRALNRAQRGLSPPTATRLGPEHGPLDSKSQHPSPLPVRFPGVTGTNQNGGSAPGKQVPRAVRAGDEGDTGPAPAAELGRAPRRPHGGV